MNHALVIARRELRDRSRLFVLAAALAVVPFIASLMPGARGYQSDIIAMGGAILGVALGIGIAITLGNTTIGRELSERRLSFYFARPLSPAALWIGKAAAALAISIGCFLIVALPAFLAVRGVWSAGFINAPAILLVGILGIVVLFFVSHSMSTVVRSRSALVALDLALLATAVGVLYATLRAVAFAGALRHALVMLGVILVAVLLVLMAAPVWQLANGRTDLRRSHAAFSRALWPAIAAIVIVAGLYTAWLITPGPEDVAYVQLLEPAPNGAWMLVGGQMENRPQYWATFAVNRASRESIRMPSPLWWGASFSRDGRVLAWMQPTGVRRFGPFRLHTRRLDVPDAENVDTGIQLMNDEFVLSDDGARVATLSGNVLAVYELAGGKLLASAATHPRERHSLFFASPDVVRIYSSGNEGATRIGELHIGSRSFTRTGQTAAHANVILTASADGSRMLLRPGIIADGRTGATLAALPPWNARDVRPRMLHDGKVARVGLAGGAIHVQTFDADGSPRHDTVLPGMQDAVIAGDTADGKLIVLASRAINKDRNTFVLDLESGVVERVMENTRGPWMAWHLDPRRMPFQGELVGADENGEIVLWKHKGRAEARPLFSSR